jgi:hypothetical protein
MSKITIEPILNVDYTKPADFQTYIQAKINSLSKNSEIDFKGEFNIGENTIRVEKPLKIRGVPDDTGQKPRITGSSGSVLKGNTDMDCGIFSISGTGVVEITNLSLEHTPVLNKHFDAAVNNPAYPDDPNNPGKDDPSAMCHGSATIACFVDNLLPSSLRITDCDIFTSATSAVNIECINEADLSKPVRHDFIIRHCSIINIPGLFIGTPLEIPGGNWLSVKLGPMEPGLNEPAPHPIDVRGSYFEVSDCNLDPAKFAAIAVWLCLSDSDTKFVIANNSIATSSNAGALDLGIMFGYKDSTMMLPKGTALILNNKIQVEHYFEFKQPPASAGILVQVANENAGDWVRTIITHNQISLLHPSTVSSFETAVVGGIVYDDLTEKGSKNVFAVIDNNLIDGGTAAPPHWGICLRGSANNVIVEDNDLTFLTAAHAQIFIDGYSKSAKRKPVKVDAHNCVFSRNLLGGLKSGSPVKPPEAIILCRGSNNRFFDNDFGLSQISGWTLPDHSAGIGFVKMSKLSADNFIILDPEKFPEVQVTVEDWWDESSPDNYKYYWDESNKNEEVWLPKYMQPPVSEWALVVEFEEEVHLPPFFPEPPARRYRERFR